MIIPGKLEGVIKESRIDGLAGVYIDIEINVIIIEPMSKSEVYLKPHSQCMLNNTVLLISSWLTTCTTPPLK